MKPSSPAASTSQSSKTRKGALPPSSSESRFTVDAHWRISSFPTAVEPTFQGANDRLTTRRARVAADRHSAKMRHVQRMLYK
eukprot:scaffold153868_cov36-Tisochrysis_lutea.AAC.3